MPKEYYFCRFEEYSCVECCEGRKCVNLGELPDKTRGCLGYDVEKAKAAGIPPITDFCKNLYCWKGRVVDGVKLDTPEMLEMTLKEIRKKPVGEFRMDPDIVKPLIKNLKNGDLHQ
jgi:hypothetical protein